MTNKYEKLQILKNRCEELNYTLVTTEYVNNKTKLDIICDKGHDWHPTFDNFINKNRKCRKCADIENANRQKEKWTDKSSDGCKKMRKIISAVSSFS